MQEIQKKENRRSRGKTRRSTIFRGLAPLLLLCAILGGCGIARNGRALFSYGREAGEKALQTAQEAEKAMAAAAEEKFTSAVKEGGEKGAQNAETYQAVLAEAQKNAENRNSANNSNNSNSANSSDNSNSSNNAYNANNSGGGYAANTTAPGGSPFAEHGALRVSGRDLVDQYGNPYQLFGMSTHGLSWFPEYVNADAFATLRSWNTNCVRLAMYTAEYNGYCTGGDREALKTIVKQGVDFATSQGMYVIIDWHILNDRDPMVYKEEAKAFFAEMSSLYRDRDNIIYEICNEPNGVSWDTIKNYAQEVIPVIRANDGNAVILVGTPEWCQQVDQAAASPLNFDNIMYTLHFYAASHTDWLRERAESALNAGLPIFVSEFGMCDASGNGGNDFGQAASWMELIRRYNLSYCCWNLANKAETSSIINSWCSKTSGWTEEDLSESGRWIVGQFRSE